MSGVSFTKVIENQSRNHFNFALFGFSAELGRRLKSREKESLSFS